MPELIKQNIGRIRDYTRKHPELQCAHHFTYDVRLNRGSRDPIQYIVMG